MRSFLLLGIFTILLCAFDSPHGISSFSKAKKLLKKAYIGNQQTFYCSCNYSYIQVKGKETSLINPSSCGYTPRNPITKKGKTNERSTRIEWEHIVPAENFGRQFKCWTEGHERCVKSNGKSFKGRQCCSKVNDQFRAMEADPRNLVPAIGELNGDRSNFRYGMIEGEPRAYGKCDFEVDFKHRVAEPKEDIRGDIARTYFYMRDTYGMVIGKKDLRLLEVWNKEDPEDVVEKRRIQKIQSINNTR